MPGENSIYEESLRRIEIIIIDLEDTIYDTSITNVLRSVKLLPLLMKTCIFVDKEKAINCVKDMTQECSNITDRLLHHKQITLHKINNFVLAIV